MNSPALASIQRLVLSYIYIYICKAESLSGIQQQLSPQNALIRRRQGDGPKTHPLKQNYKLLRYDTTCTIHDL